MKFKATEGSFKKIEISKLPLTTSKMKVQNLRVFLCLKQLFELRKTHDNQITGKIDQAFFLYFQTSQ